MQVNNKHTKVNKASLAAKIWLLKSWSTFGRQLHVHCMCVNVRQPVSRLEKNQRHSRIRPMWYVKHPNNSCLVCELRRHMKAKLYQTSQVRYLMIKIFDWKLPRNVPRWFEKLINKTYECISCEGFCLSLIHVDVVQSCKRYQKCLITVQMNKMFLQCLNKHGN